NFNRIAAVAKNALVTIDVCDCAFARSGIHEGRIVSHQSEIFWAGLNLAQIHRADGSILDRECVGLASSIVGDGQSVLRHQVLLDAVNRDTSARRTIARGWIYSTATGGNLENPLGSGS